MLPDGRRHRRNNHAFRPVRGEWAPHHRPRATGSRQSRKGASALRPARRAFDERPRRWRRRRCALRTCCTIRLRAGRRRQRSAGDRRSGGARALRGAQRVDRGRWCQPDGERSLGPALFGQFDTAYTGGHDAGGVCRRGEGQSRDRHHRAVRRATAGRRCLNEEPKPMDLTTLERLPLWIGGHAVAAHTTRYGEVTNPATGEVLRHVPLADATDVDAAVASAKNAWPAWRSAQALRRARVLMRFRDLMETHKKDLARLVSQEHGKTVVDAEGSITRGIEVIEFATGIPHLLKGEFSDNVGTGVDSFSLRQAVGVCAGITPFNFPAMVPMWMFPVAIACGNTFILKPSERDPTMSLRMAELLHEAGLPDGVFNVVHGDKESVDAILAHPDIKAISFVGSTPIARYIYETGTRNGKRVQALGGAKNHAVVLPDADIGFAADAAVSAAFGSAGERCMAISAIVAVGDVADPLIKRLAERARRVSVGPGSAPNIEMGPVITRAAKVRIVGCIDQG